MNPFDTLDDAAVDLFDLTDDLSPGQFQQLLQWLRVQRAPVTRSRISAWRRHAGLPA